MINSFLVISSMILFLFGLLVLFTIIKNNGPMTYLKYPPLTECSDVADLFESIQIFEEHAVEDQD
jgi:heme/copper-type cytochrome/quinol oxidase subunit 1